MHADPLEDFATGEVVHARLHLPSEAGAGRVFRAAARDCARNAHLSPAGLQVVLVLGSEMVNNAVLHGAPPVVASIATEGSCLHLAVSDGEPAHPVARPAPPEATSGRGLHLLARLAHGWGVRDTPPGKTVWCCLPQRP